MLLAFNTATTNYLVVGSLDEEARLKEAISEGYDTYRTSGVAFYLPTPDRSAVESMRAVANLQGLPQ